MLVLLVLLVELVELVEQVGLTVPMVLIAVV